MNKINESGISNARQINEKYYITSVTQNRNVLIHPKQPVMPILIKLQLCTQYIRTEVKTLSKAQMLRK